MRSRRPGADWRAAPSWGAAAVLAVVVACLAAASGPAQGAPDLVLSGQTSAVGLDITVNSEPRLLPIEELVHLAVPWTIASLAPAEAVARAAPAWPGSSGAQGPALLCTAGFPCPDGFPPPYPLVAEAQHPSQPEAEAGGSTARARAQRDRVEAAAGALATAEPALVTLAPVVGARALEVHTQLHRTGTALVARTASVAHELALLGGVVRIAQLRSTATARVTAAGQSTAAATTEVTGVTVAGVPATITADGISVGGTGISDDDIRRAESALAAAASPHQATLRLLPSGEDEGPGAAHARAGGLHLEQRITLAGPAAGPVGEAYRTYVATATIGAATALASTSTLPSPDLRVAGTVPRAPSSPVGVAALSSPARAGEDHATPPPPPGPSVRYEIIASPVAGAGATTSSLLPEGSLRGVQLLFASIAAGVLIAVRRSPLARARRMEGQA